MDLPLIEYYIEAYSYVTSHGYFEETEYIRNIKPFETHDADDFFREYVFAVCGAGMKEQVARLVYNSFMDTLDLGMIGHPKKRDAIDAATCEYLTWFENLKNAATDDDKIAYLRTLPFMGDALPHQIARNLGIDGVKPDVHMKRLARRFGYATPLDLVKAIQSVYTDEKLGYIDIVLWRYCNLTTSREPPKDRHTKGNG